MILKRRPLLALGLAAALLVAVLAWAVPFVARAFPPRTLRMTAGPKDSADYELGERYRGALAKRGVEVQLATSTGKAENLARLNDPKSGFDAGFVSGGLTTAAESPGVASIGTIAYDPLWIFCRDIPEPVQFGNLAGKKVSIGPEGSATRLLTLTLLRLNRLDRLIVPLPLALHAGSEALRKGEIDCACVLSFAEAPEVRVLLADERVTLMSFARADAYVALFPFLRKVVLPTGIGDLAANRPPHDVTLLATAESLLVRKHTHPAIQYLLLQAAQEIHAGAGMLQRAGEFPRPEPVDVPLSDEALQFYKSGGGFLQRHLPFWLWVFASRLLIVLVPVAGAIYPLVQLIPAVIRFEVDRRFGLLYAELRKIEARIEEPGATAKAMEEELERFETEIRKARIPESYARSIYTLKHHASLVRERLARRGLPPT
jgi:NMT1 family protein